MYTITKKFSFSASHQLSHLPKTHKCHRLHGHNYKVVIELVSEDVDNNGFVLDYGYLASLKDFIDSELDHRHLNDIIPIPTAENLAVFLFHKCKEVWIQTKSISVSETDNTWAQYSED
jgi:6-pyruvoyltetrahydropterin/6-carboxytetrahydropterin synthase